MSMDQQRDNEVGRYVVTAHESGVVLMARSGSFLGPDSQDVAIVKSNRLEIRRLCPVSGTTLALMVSQPVWGRISTLLPFRPHYGFDRDVLFFTTEDHSYACVMCVPSSSEEEKETSNHPTTSTTSKTTSTNATTIRTLASGSLADGILREVECGPLAALGNSCIVLHLHDGFLQVLPFASPLSSSLWKEKKKKKKSSTVNTTTTTAGTTITSTTASTASGTSSSTNFHGKKKSILGEPVHIRIDERTVLDLCVCGGERDNQLVILHQDSWGEQHLVWYRLSLSSKSGGGGGGGGGGSGSNSKLEALRRTRVDGGSGILVSTGDDVLVLGQRSLTYGMTTVPVGPTLFLSYTSLGSSSGASAGVGAGEDSITTHKYLLGDDRGRLYLVLLETLTTTATATDTHTNATPNEVTKIHIQGIDGPVSTPTSLVYLGGKKQKNSDNFSETVFVGSYYGDAQLLTKLVPEVVVQEEYPNVGPIVDFCLGNDNKMVTCSGAGRDGSLRIIRNGIGIDEQASVDLPGIKGLWTLGGVGYEKFLVQSYLDETRVLGVQVISTTNNNNNDNYMEEEELQQQDQPQTQLREVSFPAFRVEGVTTLFCGSITSHTTTNTTTHATTTLPQQQQQQPQVYQVTERSVRLCTAAAQQLITEWNPQEIITVASGYGNQLVVALRGGTLVCLLVTPTELVETARRQLDREVSCIDLSPFGERYNNHPSLTSMSTSTLTSSMDTDMDIDTPVPMVAVGLWEETSVQLLQLPTLQQITQIPLERQEQARSVLMVTMGAPPEDLLLVGLGDGHLLTYYYSQQPPKPKQSCNETVETIDSNTFKRKKIRLGSQSITLTAFDGGVFCTGDRPTILYTDHHGRHCFSPVHSLQDSSRKTTNHVTPFRLYDNITQEEECLCLADADSLCIGTVDDIQKLHVQTVPMEGARRIAYHAPAQCFAVGCEYVDETTVTTNTSQEQFCIRFLDASTMDEFDRIDLDSYETPLTISSVSLTSCEVNDHDNNHINNNNNNTTKTIHNDRIDLVAVGTAYGYPDQDEPTRGRVLLYEIHMPKSAPDLPEEDDPTTTTNTTATTTAVRTVRLVAERSVKGGVYSLAATSHHTRLLASVNSRTHLFALSNQQTIESRAVHHGHLLSLHIRAQDDVAIVGDLMRSISVLAIGSKHDNNGNNSSNNNNNINDTVEEVARDFHPNWTTAVEMATAVDYLGAENWNNLFALRRTPNAPTEEERCRLDTVGEYHLGEMVNVLRKGTLLSSSSSLTLSPTVTFTSMSTSMSTSTSASMSKSKGLADKIGSRILYATVDGSVGTVLGMDAALTQFLGALERCMADPSVTLIPSVGNFSYETYRAFRAERRVRCRHGFVDGDLVEAFLNLDRTTQERVVQRLNEGYKCDNNNNNNSNDGNDNTDPWWKRSNNNNDDNQSQGQNVWGSLFGATTADDEEEDNTGGISGVVAMDTTTGPRPVMVDDDHTSHKKRYLTVDDVVSKVEEMSRLH